MSAATTEKTQLQLRQVLTYTDCHCKLRILDSDGSYEDVTMTAPTGQLLLDKLRRSRAVDGELILGLVPNLTTVDDSVLLLSVRVPPPKQEPKVAGTDCAAELPELAAACVAYSACRDAERDFTYAHGLDVGGQHADERAKILSNIARTRKQLQGILRRATGDASIKV